MLSAFPCDVPFVCKKLMTTMAMVIQIAAKKDIMPTSSFKIKNPKNTLMIGYAAITGDTTESFPLLIALV